MTVQSSSPTATTAATSTAGWRRLPGRDGPAQLLATAPRCAPGCGCSRARPTAASSRTRPSPDIIKEVFRDHGFTDFEDRSAAATASWEYCVQYRETDFNFVSRLMEEEGIYYFFEHEDGKHTLVLADAYSAHEALPGYEEIPYLPARRRTRPTNASHIDDWTSRTEMQPGRVRARRLRLREAQGQPAWSKPPGAAAARRRRTSRSSTIPGDYLQTRRRRALRATRASRSCRRSYERGAGQRQRARRSRRARSSSSTEHPRERPEPRVPGRVGAQYELRVRRATSRGGDARPKTFRCTFAAIDSQQPFRARRTHAQARSCRARRRPSWSGQAARRSGPTSTAA